MYGVCFLGHILGCEVWSSEAVAYPGFESDEFEEHLYSENRSKDHVEDVHHIVEGRWLPIMLEGKMEVVSLIAIIKNIYISLIIASKTNYNVIIN